MQLCFEYPATRTPYSPPIIFTDSFLDRMSAVTNQNEKINFKKFIFIKLNLFNSNTLHIVQIHLLTVTQLHLCLCTNVFNLNHNRTSQVFCGNLLFKICMFFRLYYNYIKTCKTYQSVLTTYFSQ